jgi:DNA repair exonuclease SbcCD ATPase subunit
MGDTKHTPGPWNAVELEDGNIVTGNTRHCGNVCELDLGTESEANARLIAAAPELLEALERMHEEARGVVVDGGCCPFCGILRHEDHQQHAEDCALSTARAAIEKARGGR